LEPPAGLVLAGIGIAATQSPLTAAAMQRVPVASAGIASGVLNRFRQVGGAIGIAVLGAVRTSRASSALASGTSRPQAFIDGFSMALEARAIIAFVGAWLRPSSSATRPRRSLT
jgi:hypothetical protein